MECPTRNKEIDILLDYCARKTDAETAAALERHIAACAE